MANSAHDPLPFVSRISLIGRRRGPVKSLAGFKKQHHTVPDSVNAATSAFLGKLCAGELAAEAEGFYQRTRSALGYKRGELALALASPTATLRANDFAREIAYALDGTGPANYVVTRRLHALRRGELVEQPAFDRLFAGMFSSIVFILTKSVRVEAVIDAVEALGKKSDLMVSYPSDCQHCILTIESIEANVVLDGATLEMRFPRSGSPRELVAAFAAARSAFAVKRDRALAGLL